MSFQDQRSSHFRLIHFWNHCLTSLLRNSFSASFSFLSKVHLLSNLFHLERFCQYLPFQYAIWISFDLPKDFVNHCQKLNQHKVAIDLQSLNQRVFLVDHLIHHMVEMVNALLLTYQLHVFPMIYDFDHLASS